MPTPIPTLNRTFLALKKEVGHFLGWGRDNTAWISDQTSLIEELVNSGYRQFLLPPAIGDAAPHRWSFLVGRTATIELATSIDVYDMPADWGGGTKEFYWATAQGTRRLPVIAHDEMMSLKSMNDSDGTPLYASIHPKAIAHSDGTAHRWEVVLHPQPDSNFNTKVLACNYTVDLDALSTDTNYPVGGAVHSEVLLESCLAAAELRVHDELGAHNVKFMERLAASVQYDQSQLIEPAIGRTSTYPEGIDDPATGELTFQQLKREVGSALGYGRNQDGWDNAQLAEIESICNRGYRRFIHPDDGHVWSFLTQQVTIALSSGTGDYNLPADFGGVIEGSTIHY